MSTTLLLEAVDAGDEETVMRVLNAYPEAYQEGGCLFGNILLCERDRVTLLMRAALVGHLEVLKLLACRGGAINALSHLDRTALYYAAQEGHEEVVAYLLSNGADPMRLDEFGCTPLVSASMRGHLGVVLLLLEHMGEQGLEARDHEDGHTALHWAVWQGHEEVVAHLLRHGARADTMSSSGKSTLRAAVSHGHVGVVRLLVNHLGPQALQEADVQGRTLLHLAVHMSHEDVTTFLLRKGLRTDARDNRGDTPLLVSAMRGPLAVMLRVLEHMDGQGLDLGDNYGRTALHLAVIGHCPENVLALLLAGADYTIMDVRGATAHAMAEVEAWDEGFGFPECAHVFRWWNGELERRSILYQARTLHDAHMTHQQAPTYPVPAYLKARVKAGLALPRVEVVERETDGTGSEREGEGEGQQERHAVLKFVVGQLSEELFTELIQGFHARNSD